MIAVYSHWQKPFEMYGGGFISRRHFIASLSYSALLSKRYFKKVVMYCDLSQKDEFENLRIFDEVIPFFEDISNVPPKHWAIAKLSVYAVQKEPFLHIDNDVFLLKCPPDKIFTGELVAQSEELSEEFLAYDGQVRCLERTEVYPKYWIHDWKENHKKLGSPYSFNAGILGGTRIDLIRDYAETSIAHIKRFGHQYPDVNTAVEQLYFGMMSHLTQTPVTTIINSWKDIHHCKDMGYRHFWGGTKKSSDPITNKPYMEDVVDELKNIRPDIYDFVNSLN